MSQNSIAKRRGPIVWVADLAAVNTTTSYPSGSSAGVAIPAGVPPSGERVHVMLSYSAASGTLSTDCHLYGYDPTLGLWPFLGSMNAGASIVADTRWQSATSAVLVSEWFDVGHGQYSRFATRVIAPQGTTPSCSTWIGFEAP